MNVTKENVDKLNALLKVTVEPTDYKQKVDASLAGYRKKANISGFRKGKVPLGIVKKQYGKALLTDELNKLVSDALFRFIEAEKLDILGNPLPKKEDHVVGDFDNPDTFEFTYEVGLSPDFDIQLSSKSTYDFPKVKIDDSLINKQINDFRRRYGKLVSGESVGETDMILGQFVELNENGQIKEGGILNSSSISMEFIEDETTKKELLGKKIGDKVVISASNVSRGDKDKAAMLGVKEADLGSINNQFQLTINEVKVMEMAEVNQELFDKLFGVGTITSEKEMRERIASDLAVMFEEDSDKILARRITNDLIQKTDINLPDDFLKRWILASQKEQSLTLEDVQRNYDSYAKGLKWQLIQKEIFKKNDLQLKQEEVIEYTKGLLLKQYAQYGIPAPENQELAAIVQSFLAKKEEADRIYERMAEIKLVNYFKSTVKLNDKEVDYETYMKIAQDVTA